jgi:hypothetical protein
MPRCSGGAYFHRFCIGIAFCRRHGSAGGQFFCIGPLRIRFFGRAVTPCGAAPNPRRPSILAAAFALLGFGNAAIQPYGLKLSIVKNELESVVPGVPGTRVLEFVRWNSFSRVSAGPSDHDAPAMWEPSSEMPPSVIEQRRMAIDGSAGTAIYRFDGDFGKLEFLKYDVTNLAYHIRHAGRAAVIGVGGGRDLLSARLFGFRDITGVELNPIFVDMLLRGFRSYNHLADLQGMRLFVDEARSWVCQIGRPV